MSKKKKSTAAIPAASPTGKTSSSQTAVPVPSVRIDTPKPDNVAELEPTFELIRFDKRVKWFLGICVGLFILLTLAKINYSSIAIWNQVLPDGSDLKRGLITGTPRQIRMDDWAGGTPMTMSQVNNGFPLENPSLGGEKPSMVCGVPNKHFTTFFRPENWGYILFSLERGFAWRWNFVVFAGFLSIFLLLLLLTRNQFWLSAMGAFWLAFSPGIAWWSLNNLTFMYSGSLLLLSSLYIFYARSIPVLIGFGLLYIWSFVVFCLLLYPPYQVPLGYLLILLLIGFVWRYYNKEILFNKLWLKLGVFATAFILIGIILYFYYLDAKSTIEVMSNTVYPGRRSETGGTGFVANWLSEYYSGWLLTDQRIPKDWMNICELSHFVTFTPIIAVSLIVFFTKTQKVDPLLTILIIYTGVLLIWIEIGFPEFLAKATLLDVSPTRRTQVPLGIANVFITILYLAYLPKIKASISLSAALIGLAILFMIYAAWLNLSDSQGFYKSHQLFLPTLFFILLNILLLPSVNFNRKELIVAGAMVLFTLPSLKINPVGVGMTPITENAFYKKVSELHKQDLQARWAVFGSQYLTYIVTATGANQLSGMKYMPDYKTMRVLDPQAKRDSVYNRFAHVVYNSYINGRDTVVIFNPYQDAYTVAMDACSPRLKQLNAKYFVFDKVPQPVEVRCMTQVAELGNVRIYKRNDF